MIYEIEATIPTTQYGNLRPKFTVEDNEDEVLGKLKGLWDRFGEKPLADKTVSVTTATREEVVTFTGETVLMDRANHKYFSKEGKQLMSGSVYASIGEKAFDKAMILPKTAKSWGVTEGELDNIWEINGRISNEYGTAVHSALELFLKHHLIGAKIASSKGLEQNYVMTKVAHLNTVIEQFWALYGKSLDLSIPEVLVSDVKNLMAGQIDLLHILDKDNKVCRIGDYKTNYELDDKKIAKYHRQLSFYGNIMKNHGWTVEGVDIYHYSDKWEKISLDLLPMEPFTVA
jgi:hypothetical protein